jgi:hypothetical protein
MTDFLDAKRREIDERLKELRPLVDEFRRLEQAAAALAGVGARAGNGGRPSSSGTRRAGRGRAGGGGRRGRPRGSGTRALQALELVRARPGITIPELAEQMSIKQNYLYRVMPTLEQEKKVAKQGRGWHPVGSA